MAGQTGSLSKAEEKLVDGCLAGLRGGAYPVEVTEGTIDRDCVYRVQFAVTERQVAAGRTLAGWKTGTPPPPILEQLGGKGLVCGPLYADGLRDSGASIPASTPGLLLEVEVGALMGTDLEGPNLTEADARDAVTSVAPCFELLGGNVPKINIEKFLGMIAIGVGNFGVVAGAPVSARGSDLNFDALETEILVAGQPSEGHGNQGSPFQGIADLANFISDYDQRLLAGQRIITGARAILFEVPPGEYEGRISDLGSVHLTVT